MQKFILTLIVLLYSIGSCLNAKTEHKLVLNSPVNFFQAIQNIKNNIELYKHIELNSQQLFKNSYKFNSIFDSVIEYLKNIRQDNKTDADKCGEKVDIFLKALEESKLWPMKLIDSFGKPTSGILQGSISWLGEYSECKNLKDDDGFNAKYMTIPLLLVFNSTDTTFPIKYGFCAPEECLKESADLLNYLITSVEATLSSIDVILYPVDSSSIKVYKLPPIDAPAIVALVIISIFVSLVIIASTYEIITELRKKTLSENKVNIQSNENSQRLEIQDENSKNKIIKLSENEEKLIIKILLTFSAYTNVKKIFKISKNNTEQLECLNGIRVLSIAWVVLGHNFSFVLNYSNNIQVLLQWLGRFYFLIVANAFVAVDTFFVLSGLLGCYLFLKELDRQKLSTGLMAKYYIHRLWRITPTYLIAMMISITLTKYLGAGPLFSAIDLIGFEYKQCHETWWQNVIYLNNIIGDDKQCSGVSWYLANDMQFHWVAPLMLIPLALGKNKKIWKNIGFCVAGLFIVTSIITTATFLSVNKKDAYLAVFAQDVLYYLKKVYFPPWARIGPFVVGVLLGHLIYENRKLGKWLLSKKLNLLLWMISFALMLLVIFIIHPNFTDHPLSKEVNIIYQTFFRLIWSLSLGFVIYSCLSSCGGIVNTILCWSIWQPLSKISFSVYLTHTMVLLCYNSLQEHAIHVQYSNLIYQYIANLVASFTFGLVFCLVFEIPLTGLEKFIFKSNKKTK